MGLGTVDSILPIGRGQRQLILGDRYTGKTSIFLSLVRHGNRMNSIGSIDGLGTRRLIVLYIGINQNLSKLSSTISEIMIDRYCLILAAHAPSSSSSAFLIPLIGVSIGERLRDRGLDCCICSDDPSKHSKSYRQTSSISGKIPSRDASPADIPNIHAPVLERPGRLKYSSGAGSITALPITETINPDITEHIATNVIPITDGQFHTNRKLFLESIRPAVDPALSASRIGTNAQAKLMKVYSVGPKNLITS